MTLANKDDEAEQHTIAEVVGDHGRVELNWSEELCKQVFDMRIVRSFRDCRGSRSKGQGCGQENHSQGLHRQVLSHGTARRK